MGQWLYCQSNTARDVLWQIQPGYNGARINCRKNGRCLMGFVMNNPARLWPGGEIPYEIAAGGIAADARTAIRRWNAAIGRHIRFVPHRGQQDYVCIRVAQGRSESELGRRGGRQNISINPAGARALLDVDRSNGSVAGIIIHEMGHAAGLLHEHQRRDRNEYVEIHWDLVAPGRCGDFWSAGDPQSRRSCPGINDERRRRYERASGNGPYDPDSVMHYLSTHARARRGTHTITPTGAGTATAGRPGSEPFPGHHRGTLSEGDRAALTALYPLLNWSAITCVGRHQTGGLLQRSATRSERGPGTACNVRPPAPLGVRQHGD